MDITEYFDAEYFNTSNKVLSSPAFRKGLHLSGACISGSSVLEALRGNPYYKYNDKEFIRNAKTDIDIYVSRDNAPVLLESLYPSGNRPDIVYPMRCYATPYDDSFFKRNNIGERIFFDMEFKSEEYSVDIMIVNEVGRNPVEDVVSNFDLSCCENWVRINEDGSYTVRSTSYPDSTLLGKCYLSEEYLDAFVKGNTFIRKRIKKYRKRGFQITLLGEATLNSLYGKYEEPKTRVMGYDSGFSKPPILDCSEDKFNMGLPFTADTDVQTYYDQCYRKLQVSALEKYGCYLNNLVSERIQQMLEYAPIFLSSNVGQVLTMATDHTSIPLSQFTTYENNVDNSVFKRLDKDPSFDSVYESIKYLEQQYHDFMLSNFSGKRLLFQANIPWFTTYDDEIYRERSFLFFMYKQPWQMFRINQRIDGKAVQNPYVFDPIYNKTLVIHWFVNLHLDNNPEFNTQAQKIAYKILRLKTTSSVIGDFGEELVDLWRIGSKQPDAFNTAENKHAMAFLANAYDLDSNITPRPTTESIQGFVDTINETYRAITKKAVVEDAMEEIYIQVQGNFLKNTERIVVDDLVDMGVGCSHRACDDRGVVDMRLIASQGYEKGQNEDYDDIVFLRRNGSNLEVVAITTKEDLRGLMGNPESSNIMFRCPEYATGEEFVFTFDQVGGAMNSRVYVQISTTKGNYFITLEDAKYLFNSPTGRLAGETYPHKFFILEDETIETRFINATLVEFQGGINLLGGTLDAVSGIHCAESKYQICRMIECDTPTRFNKVEIAEQEEQGKELNDLMLVQKYPELIEILKIDSKDVDNMIEREIEIFKDDFLEEMGQEPSVAELEYHLKENYDTMIGKKRLRKLLMSRISFEANHRELAMQMLRSPSFYGVVTDMADKKYSVVFKVFGDREFDPEQQLLDQHPGLKAEHSGNPDLKIMAEGWGRRPLGDLRDQIRDGEVDMLALNLFYERQGSTYGLDALSLDDVDEEDEDEDNQVSILEEMDFPPPPGMENNWI